MRESRGSRAQHALRRAQGRFQLDFHSRIYIYSAIVGVLSGAGAVIFTYGLELFAYVCFELIAGYEYLLPAGAFHFHFYDIFPPEHDRRLWVLILLPAAGGLLSGYLAHRFAPEAEGPGGDAMIDAFHNKRGLVRPIVPVVKAITTIITLGSGGSAGFFGPSLFIGGMLGGALGTLGHQYYPAIVQQPAAYVVVGMASFFGAVANTPLAALIIVTEMTGSYHLLPPLMLVSAVTLIFARDASIYEKQVQNKFHSPAHLRDYTVDVLEQLRVAEVLPLLTSINEAVVRNDTPYLELRALSRRQGHLHFAVINAEGELRGMVRLDDLEVPGDEALRRLVLIEDMVIENVEPICETDDLHQALSKLLNSGFDKLPVIRRQGGEQKFVGCMMYRDLLRLYHEEIERRGRHE